METKLNQLLSDFVVEYHKLQNFHWYVKGASFFNVHAKLEELYDAFNASIDEIAEVMLMSSMKPVGSLQEFLAITKIEEAKTEEVAADVIYKIVLADFEYLNNLVIEIKKDADESGNYVVSSAMDNLIINFAKTIWMIKQTLK